MLTTENLKCFSQYARLIVVNNITLFVITQTGTNYCCE